MGYSYTMGGKLCCDVCSKSGGVRKIKCPAGYCQAIAQCPACRKDTAIQARIAISHKDCGRRHTEYMAELAERDAKLADGKYVLASALQVREGCVHVLFRNAAGTYLGYYMAPELYGDRLPNAWPVPDDFAARGTIIPAPDDFQKAA